MIAGRYHKSSNWERSSWGLAPFTLRSRQFFLGSAFGGGPPALAAFSRSSCSRRNCSNRLSRFIGGALGLGAGRGAAAAAVGAGVAPVVGGEGAAVRGSLDPTLWTLGSPFSVMITWQKMFLCVPAGAVGSTLSGNATSLESLVNFSS